MDRSFTNMKSASIIDDAGNVKFSSEIWRHFDVEDDEAICGLCRESIPSSLEDMKNHLEEKHSSVLDDIAQKVLDAASEEDVLGDDDMYTEVVYLEDDKKTFEKPEKPKKRSKVPKVKTERNGSTSSDEFVQKPKHKKKYETDKKEPDELEMFIKYITVLLKKVPKESSQKLHLDIINSIMNATQPQNKIVMETLTFDNATTLDKSLILSQNCPNTSDVNLNNQRGITVPLQHLVSRNETNTVPRVVTVSNTNEINTNTHTNSVSKTSFLPELRMYSNTKKT